jgi:hypothetical protein
MANINKIPSPLLGDDQSGGLGNEVLNQMLVELLRDLSLNKNIFTTDLSDTEDEEILEAYGYKLYSTLVKDNDGNSGNISVALPSTLSDSEVKKALKGIKTFDEAYLYYPKVVLERENRKLYVKLIKKLIHDCNS